MVLASRRLAEAGKRRVGAFPGSGGGLGCPALPAICSGSDCGGARAIAGRSGVYASKSVPGAFDDGGNLRDALYPSGAKDDPRDADLLLDLLLKHRDKLRRFSPDTEATRRVQNLVEERRKLVDEKTEQIKSIDEPLEDLLPADAGLV